MPAYRCVNLGANGAYLVWRVTEPVALLAASVALTPAEKAEYMTITHARRQREWLAARVALRALLDQQAERYTSLQKDCWGKPYLVDSHLAVGLAHCNTFACAAVDRQRPIGIDIQQPQERLRSIKEKFLQPDELQAVGDSLQALCMYWCAKEAIYKAVGGKGLSLRQDISILPAASPSQDTLQGVVLGKTLSVHHSFAEGHVLAWCRDEA